MSYVRAEDILPKELIETIKEITSKNLKQEEKVAIKNVLYNILSRSISQEIID